MIPRLLGDCARRAGATSAELTFAERELAAPLPEDYRTFLRETNGTEGFISTENYLMLWRADEIPKLNKGYAVGEFAPGLVLLGTDGGGSGYGFLRRPSGSVEYVRVPLIGLSLQDAVPLGKTFDDFLSRLGRGL